MKYVMGADIGTQSVKVQLYNQDMNVIATSSIEHYVDTPKPAWATQNANNWWKLVCENIHNVLDKSAVNPEDIVGFGCCGHMHGATPVREDGTVIDENVQLYCDKRAGDIADALAERLTDEEYALSANAPISAWHGLKVKWIKDNLPEVYKEAYKFLTPKDFIVFKLTGVPSIDPSEASGTFCMDCNTNEWSDTLIAEVGIDKEKLPTIHKAYEIVGKISEKAAKETGLSTNTAVIAGGGDMLAMLYASGMYKLGTVVDNTGTGGSFQAYTEKPVMDKRIMNLRHVLEGWVPFGGIDTAGGAYRWIRDNLAKDETKIARANGRDEYDYLNEIASATPAGAEGLYFFPYLMGERTMGTPDSRGCFIGLSLDKTIGHIVRAVLEGETFDFKRVLDIFEASGAKVDVIWHCAGGAKGDLWNQIKADIYNKPIYTLEADQGGVLGVALMAAVATGLQEDLEKSAEAITKIKKVYQPNPANREIYDAMYKEYCRLHDALMPEFKNMADIQREFGKQ